MLLLEFPLVFSHMRAKILFFVFSLFFPLLRQSRWIAGMSHSCLCSPQDLFCSAFNLGVTSMETSRLQGCVWGWESGVPRDLKQPHFTLNWRGERKIGSFLHCWLAVLLLSCLGDLRDFWRGMEGITPTLGLMLNIRWLVF